MASIVVCADGTWNRPEEDIEKDQPTNVQKLARAVKPNPPGRRQQVFYDWGLGSYTTAWLRERRAGASTRTLWTATATSFRTTLQRQDLSVSGSVVVPTRFAPSAV